MAVNNAEVSFRESWFRSFVKCLIYRAFSLIGTAILTWYFTEDIGKTISITVTIQVFLIVLYYVYERIWDRSNWGRKTEIT